MKAATYHLRLTRKGNVKIFENVISHKIEFNNDKIIIIQQKDGALIEKVTTLKFHEYYSIRRFETPEYELDGDWLRTKVELF